MIRKKYFFLLLLIFSYSCEDNRIAKIFIPKKLSIDAIGYFCSMTLLDHYGPKGQIYLSDQNDVIWFSTVRDTIAFSMLPEEKNNIKAIFVSDMSKKSSWTSNIEINWVEAKKAFYVINSSVLGGMGEHEAIPFYNIQEANTFIKENGGVVVSFLNIPKTYILNIQ